MFYDDLIYIRCYKFCVFGVEFAKNPVLSFQYNTQIISRKKYDVNEIRVSNSQTCI